MIKNYFLIICYITIYPFFKGNEFVLTEKKIVTVKPNSWDGEFYFPKTQHFSTLANLGF